MTAHFWPGRLSKARNLLAPVGCKLYRSVSRGGLSFPTPTQNTFSPNSKSGRHSAPAILPSPFRLTITHQLPTYLPLSVPVPITIHIVQQIYPPANHQFRTASTNASTAHFFQEGLRLLVKSPCVHLTGVNQLRTGHLVLDNSLSTVRLQKAKPYHPLYSTRPPPPTDKASEHGLRPDHAKALVGIEHSPKEVPYGQIISSGILHSTSLIARPTRLGNQVTSTHTDPIYRSS